MKIGIDARMLVKNRDGIGNYAYNLIKTLNQIDKENEYVLYSNKEIYLDFKLNNNFSVVNYNKKIGSMFLYFKLGKILKNDKIDVFLGTSFILPKKNKNTKNIKKIAVVHDLAIFKIKGIGSNINTIIQHTIAMKSIKNADKIIAISKSTKKDIIEIAKIQEDKIDVIYLGTNELNNIVLTEKDMDSIRKKFNVKDNNFIFFLSTIEPRKNVKTLVKAFELYKNKKNDDVKLILSGKIGWKSDDVINMINNSMYKKDIKLTGFISEKEKSYFYKYCNAFCYPSLYEGFGLPVLEAMQYGTIVITSNNSSLPEVGGNVAIYLNNVNDYAELESIFENVMEMSKSEREEIKKKGIEQAKKFTWEKNATETLNVIKGLKKI